jgi:carboxypeptidase C (cathepsin A)
MPAIVAGPGGKLNVRDRVNISRMLAAAVVLALAAGMARADETPRPHPTAATSAPTTVPATRERQGGDVARKDNEPVVTEHQITIGGQVLRYKATAGTLTLKDDAGKPRASMFFVAYNKLGEGIDPATRPITYVFNGGPGAASVWLHLGAVGPKRIDLEPDGRVGPPPYRLVDNEQTWLDLTDLVFIDPVGSGYSRPADGEKPDQFYGVE